MQSYQENGKSAGLFEKPGNYRYQDTDDEELASINRQVINQNQQNNQPMNHHQVHQPGQMQHFSSEDSNNLELKLDASPEMEMMNQSDMKSDADSDGPQTKIFVGGLSWQTTTDSLISYFQSFGEIKEAMVMKDPQTQRSRGFGFVTFEEEDTVNEVIRFGKHEIDGKSVDPKIAFPKRGQPKMVTKTKKIFVGGLSSTTVQDDIHKYFSKFGEVDEAMLMFDRQTNRHRGFGFVTFVEEDTVDRVCEILCVSKKPEILRFLLKFSSSIFRLLPPRFSSISKRVFILPRNLRKTRRMQKSSTKGGDDASSPKSDQSPSCPIHGIPCRTNGSNPCHAYPSEQRRPNPRPVAARPTPTRPASKRSSYPTTSHASYSTPNRSITKHWTIAEWTCSEWTTKCS